MSPPPSPSLWRSQGQSLHGERPPCWKCRAVLPLDSVSLWTRGNVCLLNFLLPDTPILWMDASCACFCVSEPEFAHPENRVYFTDQGGDDWGKGVRTTPAFYPLLSLYCTAHKIRALAKAHPKKIVSHWSQRASRREREPELGKCDLPYPY